MTTPDKQPPAVNTVYTSAPSPALPIYWIDGAPFAYDGATLVYAPYVISERHAGSARKPETDR